MTRNTIINEYFSRRFKGEKVTIESIVKSYNLSKNQLVDLCKKEFIYYRSGSSKEEILDRVIGSISHIIYALDCCRK